MQWFFSKKFTFLIYRCSQMLLKRGEERGPQDMAVSLFYVSSLTKSSSFHHIHRKNNVSAAHISLAKAFVFLC
jgi:hypothetical protein